MLRRLTELCQTAYFVGYPSEFDMSFQSTVHQMYHYKNFNDSMLSPELDLGFFCGICPGLNCSPVSTS